MPWMKYEKLEAKQFISRTSLKNNSSDLYKLGIILIIYYIALA